MTIFTRDDGIQAGFNCRLAMSFAKGIPLLKDHNDLDAMTVTDITDITENGVSVFLEKGVLKPEEMMPHRVFLFSSDKDLFILNLAVTSIKMDLCDLQIAEQDNKIFSLYLKYLINEKKKVNPSDGYYELITEEDRIPDILGFIVNMADEAWDDYDWEKEETYEALFMKRWPEFRYYGYVDLKKLTPKRIQRFGKEMQCIISLSQAKDDENQVKKVLEDYADVLEQMDEDTRQKTLAFLGS